MSKIYCIIGKSGAGKDTIYKKILEQQRPDLIPVIPCTTRPRRIDEVEGVNYHFVDEVQLAEYKERKQILELRSYHTTQGIWSYFTLKFPLEAGKDYILITTLEGVEAMLEHYDPAVVQVVYLYIPDRERLERCIQRESLQAVPNYAEVCRRFLADQEDFSEERLKQLPQVHFIDTSVSVEDCVKRWNRLYQKISVESEGIGR